MLEVMSSNEEESLSGGSVASRIKLLKANFEQGPVRDRPGNVSPRSVSPQPRNSELPQANNGVNDKPSKIANAAIVANVGPSPKPLPKPAKLVKDIDASNDRRPRSGTAPETESEKFPSPVSPSLKEKPLVKAGSDVQLHKDTPKPVPRVKPLPPAKGISDKIKQESVSPAQNVSSSVLNEQKAPRPTSPRPGKPSRPERPSHSPSIKQPKPPVPKKLTKLDRPQKTDQAMAIFSSVSSRGSDKENRNIAGNHQRWKHQSGPPKRPLPAGPGSKDINSNDCKSVEKKSQPSVTSNQQAPQQVSQGNNLTNMSMKTTGGNDIVSNGVVKDSTKRRPAPSPREGSRQQKEVKRPPIPKRPPISSAEEQSLYSYALEPHMILPTVGSPGLHKDEQSSDAEDHDYVYPDEGTVQNMMKSMNKKGRQNNDQGRYEDVNLNTVITKESTPIEYIVPDENSVKEFIDAVEKKQEQVISHQEEDDEDDYVSPDEDIIPPPPVPKQPMYPSARTETPQTQVQTDDSSSDEDDPTYVDPNGLTHTLSANRRMSIGVLSPDAYLPADMHEGSDYVDPENLPSVPSHLKNIAEQPNVASLTESNADSDDDGDEPLYQVYAANLVETQRRMSTVEEPGNDKISNTIPYGTGTLQRTLWSELNSVRRSGILESLSSEERKRQEAMFEVITSEASYLKSLHILCSHFLAAPEFGWTSHDQATEVVLDKQQRHFLFSGITAVTKISEAFIGELKARQEENVLISTISDIIEKYATSHFDCYVKYCSNQIFQDRTLNALITSNPRFCEVLGRLECSPKAQSLSMQSFLMLPMQRITRMPLLVDAICHRCEAGSEDFEATDRALRAVSKVVRDCNEGARRLERTEEMYFLQCMLTFKTKPIPLISSSRWLLRRGEVTCVQEESREKGKGKGTKSRSPLIKRLKGKTKELYLFLFTDLLLVAKMKSEDNFKVIDHCSRGFLRVEDIQPQSSDTLKPGMQELQTKHLFSLILLENWKGKTVEYICTVDTETDKLRWLDAFVPKKLGENEGETIYEEWDCPQVQAIHNYQATQPDEITLQEGDVVNVLRKLSDGWYEGQRLRDGEQGWFPANHTEEIISQHVRARNLMQRYRLLNASHMMVSSLLSK